ncbi:MAG: PqqD family protein [Wenzhouxiangella sp.]|jgi:hypothetical protein|nr:PqqD family protein [Wenzhouxiangella sp.]
MSQTPGLEAIAQALDKKRLTINPLDDGSGVVLDVDDEQLLTMNATGITIMQAIADGARNIDAIARVVTAVFEVDLDEARQDVRGFIETVAGQLK